MDERERHEIEARLSDVERRLALLEVEGRVPGDGDAEALRRERNGLRGRLASWGRDAVGDALPHDASTTG